MKQPSNLSVHIAVLALLACVCPAFGQQVTGPKTPKEVTGWLIDHAIPIETVEPLSGFSDFGPVGSLLTGFRLVAVGEATHGTREFFQFKHRVFEFLVERLGFTSFAMEAGYAEGLHIDQFLQTGIGTASEAAISTRFVVWSTEEVAAMLQWMRDYNADPAHTRKIRFYGIDMQFPDSASRRVLQYLGVVDPAVVSDATQTLAHFSTLARSAYLQLSQSERDADAAALAALISRFDTFRNAYIAASDEESWAFARQAAVVVSQAQRSWGTSDFTAIQEIRDTSMAQNALWALGRSGGTGTMLWAHNGHVFADAIDGQATMGQYLRAALSNALLVIGQQFDQGRFSARRILPSPGFPILGIEEFNVGPSLEGSLNDALASTKIPLYLVDVRQASSDPAGGAWWSDFHLQRQIGCCYYPLNDHYLYVNTQTTRGFDLIMYVDRTTAARQLPR